MNKIKRLILYVNYKTLRFSRFLSNKRYKKKSYKYFKKCGIDFQGMPKYINYDVNFDLTKPNLIHIGEGVVITREVIILTHDYSIECGLVSLKKCKPDYESQFLKDVYIGNNVFIGNRTIVLPGTIIEDNVIIGAGSVVSGKVKGNGVYVGNPLRKIASLDEWTEKKIQAGQIVKGTKN